MRGNPGFTERSAERYLPYLGHARPDVAVLNDGSYLVLARLRGLPHELATTTERNGAARTQNALWRNLNDDSVTVGAYLVRHRRVAPLPPARHRNAFAAELDRVYRERVLDGRLFENTWFIALLLAPRLPVTGTRSTRRLNQSLARIRKRPAEIDPERLDELEHLWSHVARSLEAYHLRRLGLRRHRDLLFSEIAEALRLILYGEYLPVPLVSGPLGNAIYTDRVIFGRRAYEVRTPGAARFGAIFGFREYPDTTRPGMLDAVLSLPCAAVLAQSFGFLARPDAIARLNLKANQMTAGGDKAVSQIAALHEAQDQLTSGAFVMGMHHLSLAIYADRLVDLDRHAGMARGQLAEAGAAVAQESLGMEAAFFGQLPGNVSWRARPGAISSRNFAHLTGFGAFPQGAQQGYWGAPLLRLKTTAATGYDYVPHVADVGMTAIFGRTGSGKSTFLCALLALFDQYMADDPSAHGPDPRDAGIVVFFDKDRGGELLVRAVGGNYLVIHSGEPSGLAPLHGFDDTPYARDCLTRWLRTLIMLDQHDPLRPQDEARLARAVAAVLRLPRQWRSLEGVRQFLGWRDPLGAGARLERWCRGGALGWAFDGDHDRIDFDAPIVGFDLTAILDNPEVVGPAAQYLRDRIRPVIDGRRAVISFDECRAYLLAPQFEKEIKDFLLTLRKQNGIVILATQQPEDLLGGSFGPALVGQCHTLMFFPTPTADERVYREQLFLTPGEVRAIREDMLPGSRRILIKRRGEAAESVIVDFDLSSMPEFVAVLSGRATTVRFAERLRQEAGTDDAAIWVGEFMRRYNKEAVD
jgi:type IV secretion system protein VirB4